MQHWTFSMGLLALGALVCLPALSQQPPAPASAAQSSTVKANVEEVLLDIIVRDKKGRPITDIKPDELTVTDNGTPQTITSFRLVRGAEAISQTGATTKLDPLRQLRLVTLAFEPMGELDQRKLARSAAIDLISGEQGDNVYYAVMAINTRLLVLQQFTKDKEVLTRAIERATSGSAAPKLTSESDSIQAELKRQLGGQTVAGADQPTTLLAAASQVASQNTFQGRPPADTDFTKPVLARVMLDMLRMDQAVASQGARLTIAALKALVQGLQSMPGRKSVLYFTWGMYETPELDVPFRNLMSLANRANVTFYSVDTRGVLTHGQNQAATGELVGAAAGSATAVTRTEGAVTKAEVFAMDRAEVSGRANVQLAIRDLAEATGGFLIGDSNDLRAPLRKVNEEISSYYELTFDPHIQNYDGSFRKLAVSAGRKDVVIHARNGYFALPPEARALGLETYELPLLRAISDGKVTSGVKFRSGAVLLEPRNEGTDLSVLVEVPLHELQPKTDAAKNTLNVHCSLAALVKDAKGEVVQKLSRDRSFQVTSEQLKMGNFVDKMMVALPPGKYALESAVMDRENGKIGTARSEFTIAAKARGVGLSSLTLVRSFAPNAKGLDSNEPFQFQGASITPTLDNSVHKAPDAALRLFFVVYRDPSISAKPTVEIEFLQNGQSLTKASLPLPEPDAQGRIPYVMTVPAAGIPPGLYEVRATARQADTSTVTRLPIQIEAM
ncbi:MAG TPA: VWA domain-containing protein [Bryobacteraceae bacterium]|nr:VWA domain-containing protein [Bryobacteraceae bacterium]